MLMGVHQLSKRFGDKICFDKISFAVEDHDKIGLIGRNGCGKSTLLKVLSGLEKQDEGQIILKNGLRMRISLQDQFFDESKTILEVVKDSLKMTKESFEAESILTRLGLSDFHRSVKGLSGGEKKRLSLACALAEPCDLLLLDEPTNHLDPLMILWLEKTLMRFKGSIVMVTHDRYFLEKVCERIMELDHGELLLMQANYSAYLELKQKLVEQREVQYAKRQSFLRKETEWIRAGCQARTTKSKARIERYEALKAMAALEKTGKVEIKFDSARLGGKTIEVSGISKSLNEKCLFDSFYYLVDREDRLGIIGVNGCGKSTLMKIMAQKLMPDEGIVEIGETVRIGFLPQETIIDDLSIRVIDYLESNLIKTKEDVLSASDMLERFLFPKNMHYLTLAHCSGGERRRLALLKVLMAQPNILFLDEPTNDLDIDTLGVLEEFLEEFQGAVITVSHDRYFLDKICDHVLIFHEGTVTERVGSFSENAHSIATEPLKKEKTAPVTQKPKSKGLSYMEKKELLQLENQLVKLEEEISILEKKLNESSEYMVIKEISNELDLKREYLEESTLRWMELSEKAEID